MKNQIIGIVIKSKKEWSNDDILGIDLGGVSFEANGQVYRYDTNRRYADYESPKELFVELVTDLEELKDIWEDCPFDLDIFEKDIEFEVAEVYIAFDDSEGEMTIEDFISQTLFIERDGVEDIIELKID